MTIGVEIVSTILTACLVFILYIAQALIKWDFLTNEVLQVLIKKEKIIKKTD